MRKIINFKENNCFVFYWLTKIFQKINFLYSKWSHQLNVLEKKHIQATKESLFACEYDFLFLNFEGFSSKKIEKVGPVTTIYICFFPLISSPACSV